MATLQHTDELYHILEDEICALKILPGEALSENQLCKRFGVSRTPIRSVLQRLEQNRFVQIIPCKGTIVTAIDTGVVDQLIFQRVAVEGMVFRDFVQSCSPMEILAVEHLYNMLLEAAAGRSDPENFDFNHFLSCDLAMHEYWFHKRCAAFLQLFLCAVCRTCGGLGRFLGFAAGTLRFPYPSMFLRKASFAGCVFQKTQSAGGTRFILQR